MRTPENSDLIGSSNTVACGAPLDFSVLLTVCSGVLMVCASCVYASATLAYGMLIALRVGIGVEQYKHSV